MFFDFISVRMGEVREGRKKANVKYLMNSINI